MSDTSRRSRRPLAHPTRAAAFIYGGISVTGSIVFILVTTFTGDYPLVARYGGAAWVFLLLMIVLMPIVIPRVQRWGGKKGGPMGGQATDAIRTDDDAGDDLAVCTLGGSDTCPLPEPQAEPDTEPE